MTSITNNPIPAQHNVPATCHHSSPPDPSHTCRHWYHDGYSENFLPPLLFVMEMFDVAHESHIGRLVENGQVVMDDYGRHICDYPFLPRYISSSPPSWLIEFWCRTDRRLTYNDIRARMTAPVAQRPTDSQFSSRRDREVRGPLGLSCWVPRWGPITRVEVERVERWSNDQVTLNTTMALEFVDFPGEGSFLLCLRAKMLAPGNPQYYPLNCCLHPVMRWEYSDRIQETVDLYYELRDKATALGLQTWQILPKEQLPHGWKVVTKPRKFTHIHTVHYDNALYPPLGRRRRAAPRIGNGQTNNPANAAGHGEQNSSIEQEDVSQPREQVDDPEATLTQPSEGSESDEDEPLMTRRRRALAAAAEKSIMANATVGASAGDRNRDERH